MTSLEMKFTDAKKSESDSEGTTEASEEQEPGIDAPELVR